MKIVISPEGMKLSIASFEPDPELESHGRVFYVYVHKDRAGNIFYVGKGTESRAQSKERHPLWHHYVNTRLGGQYDVEVVRRNLLNSEAEELEAELVNQYGPQLVNWVNTGRKIDYEANARYWQLRQANEKFVDDTRPLEQSDLPRAVHRYREAMQRMYEYESIVDETGLVADLVKEMSGPRTGPPNILDRLTLCLCKLGRPDEANAATFDYLQKYPTRSTDSRIAVIRKRVDKALAKARAEKR